MAGLQVGIIGAGLSGTALLLEVARSLSTGSRAIARVHVFEQSDLFGPGLPYSQTATFPEHYLNQPLSEMGIDVGDFRAWLQPRVSVVGQVLAAMASKRMAMLRQLAVGGSGVDACRELTTRIDDVGHLRVQVAYSSAEHVARGEVPIPRALFGLYLSHLFDAATQNLASHGVPTHLHSATSVARVRNQRSPRFSLECHSGERRFDAELDIVFVASGHRSMRDRCARHSMFVPWPASTLLREAVGAASARRRRGCLRIGVLGSSLTAIDAVRTLTSGVGGLLTSAEASVAPRFVAPEYWDADGRDIPLEISFLSRSQILPVVRGGLASYRNQFLTVENVRGLAAQPGGLQIEDIYGLLRADLVTGYREVGFEWTGEHPYGLLRQAEDPFSAMQETLVDAAASQDPSLGVIWQSVYTQASDAIYEGVRLLDTSDRRLFRDALSTVHNAMVAPMPRMVADELIALHDGGVLTFAQTPADACISELSESFDVFVDGRGNPRRYADELDALHHGLLEDGLVRIDDPSGEPSTLPGIRLIGAATTGFGSSSARRCFQDAHAQVQSELQDYA